MFQYIIDRVKKTTQGWHQRFLSPGGKEILLKAIALAMPIYTMNVFRLTKEICDEINGILARFWWSSGEKKGIHWFSWERMSLPKREGGLGFRDLENFNQALLGKQVWRILQNPDCLMARIMRARYFSDGDLLNARLQRKASYAWKSILHGRDLVKKGMRFVIGNGELINMWSDPWLPDHPPRPPRSLTQDAEDCKLKNFFSQDRNHWDEEKLRECVVAEDVEKILSIKISSKAQQDLMGWHYNEDGIYSVKSGYWVSSHQEDHVLIHNIPGSVVLKQRIWKLKSPPKLKHFLWRMLSQGLPVGANLKRRHIIQDAICKRCFQEEETEAHLFFECPYARMIWRASGVSNGIINNMSSTLEEKIQECITCSTSGRLVHLQDLPTWILWRLWKSRNMLLFQRKSVPWRTLLKQSRVDAQEWFQSLIKNETSQQGSRKTAEVQRKEYWKKPPDGWIKVNVDGSFINNDVRSNAGWIYRDQWGIFKGGVQAVGRVVNNPLECEMQAILMATQHAWSRGHRKVCVESDCKKAIDIINGSTLHFDAYNWKREIQWWKQQFQEIKFQWIGREGNKVADKMARQHCEDNVSFKFHFYVPRFILSEIHNDYVRNI